MPGMTETRLNPLDTAWLFTESRATPNHVGGLLQFRLPDDAPRDFLRQLMAEFRQHRQFAAPWDRRLKYPFMANPLPAWVRDRSIDLEYHVRHAALPWPGGERELGELVGRLQSTPIDLSRPPWELTIIEGLSERRFALFVKMHHSLIDGISGMKLLQRSMATSLEASRSLPPFWSVGMGQGHHTHHARDSEGELLPTVANSVAAALTALRGQIDTVPHLVQAFARLLPRLGRGPGGMALPFNAPLSVLNGRVREKRRFATQQIPMARLRAVAHAQGSTLNDVVLTLCGGALRRFLQERGALPAKPLTAGIPVSVRPADDEGVGNAISFIVATLGTDIEDPLARLEAVRESVQQAKAHVQSLPRQAMLQYTLLLMAPTVLTMLTGIGGRIRPMFNVTVSNVPGPDHKLYFRGAELLAIYPASIVTHGQAINITCESYAGQMNFGFTACHSSVPSMQKVAVYLEESFDALERAALAGDVAAADAKPAKPSAARPARKRSTATARRPAAAKTPKPAPTHATPTKPSAGSRGTGRKAPTAR